MTLPASLPPDYHTHTALCGHAEGGPEDYLRFAEKRGIPELAITDHVPFASGYTPDIRMESGDYPGYKAAVERLRAASEHVTVLLGIEADYFAGCEKELAAWLDEHPMDIVLGSVHWLDWWDQTKGPYRSLFEGGDPSIIWSRYFELIGRMADSGLYDVVSHLDLPKKQGERIPLKQLREQALPALDRIARAGMALEINTSGIVHPIHEFYPSPELLTWAGERQIPLTFGSDAHIPERVGDRFGRAVNLAKAAGYTHYARFRQRTMEPVPLPD